MTDYQEALGAVTDKSNPLTGSCLSTLQQYLSIQRRRLLPSGNTEVQVVRSFQLQTVAQIWTNFQRW